MARLPIGFMTYPNDCTAGILAAIASPDQRPMGPNYNGELMWPVSAEYDAEANTTRVGFTYVAPTVAT